MIKEYKNKCLFITKDTICGKLEPEFGEDQIGLYSLSEYSKEQQETEAVDRILRGIK